MEVNYYVSPDACIEGDVVFGEGCVVLPGAVLSACPGTRLSIGSFCIFEEYAVFHGPSPCIGSDEAKSLLEVSIGACNHFKARASVAGITSIGEGNIFGSFSSVETNGATSVRYEIGSHSIITPYVRVVSYENQTSSSLADDAQQQQSYVVMVVPSRVTVMPATTARGPAQCSMVPRQGTRSVAELAVLTGVAGALIHDGDKEEGLVPISKDVAAESNPELGEESERSTNAFATPQRAPPQQQQQRGERRASGDDALPEVALEQFMQECEVASMEDIRKRCRLYLIHFGVDISFARLPVSAC